MESYEPLAGFSDWLIINTDTTLITKLMPITFIYISALDTSHSAKSCSSYKMFHYQFYKLPEAKKLR